MMINGLIKRSEFHGDRDSAGSQNPRFRTRFALPETLNAAVALVRISPTTSRRLRAIIPRFPAEDHRRAGRGGPYDERLVI